jgi:hypothetical protein
MTDCADYGSFSKPEAHNAVVHAIENARMSESECYRPIVDLWRTSAG